MLTSDILDSFEQVSLATHPRHHIVQVVPQQLGAASLEKERKRKNMTYKAPFTNQQNLVHMYCLQCT